MDHHGHHAGAPMKPKVSGLSPPVAPIPIPTFSSPKSVLKHPKSLDHRKSETEIPISRRRSRRYNFYLGKTWCPSCVKVSWQVPLSPLSLVCL
ncbi:Coronatine-insensitive 1-like protein [Corchorus olitorius]|uniref:Coronatine-insensitive 1-like protein n=1 Tax=Corchorus olitorius TaxID=93759 RepID=A0A1R3L054_9ROSI|nr:Coronatine-insensitive 1-like protein [Corchorus olitorius]